MQSDAAVAAVAHQGPAAAQMRTQRTGAVPTITMAWGLSNAL
jgi:hypothetical protein